MEDSGYKSGMWVAIIIAIIGLYFAMTNGSRANELQEKVDSLEVKVQEYVGIEDDYSRLLANAESTNDSIDTMEDHIVEVNNTWYNTCWDLRDAVAEIPIPTKVEY